MKIAIIGTLAVAIFLTLLATVLAFMHRRDGVSVRAAFWAGSGLAVRPQKYVRNDYLATVRTLNSLGIALFLLGVLSLVFASLRRLV